MEQGQYGGDIDKIRGKKNGMKGRCNVIRHAAVHELNRSTDTLVLVLILGKDKSGLAPANHLNMARTRVSLLLMVH